MPRVVIMFKPKKNSGVTLSEMMKKLDKYRKKHPQREIFFDGDEFAICYIKQ